MLWRRSDHPVIERWTGEIDVVHGPNFVVPPTRDAARVVTVHDLTPVRFPELSTRDTLEYPGLVRRAIADGAWVHTHSAFVAAEIVDHFAVHPDRVVVIPSGVSPLAPETDTSDAARGRSIAGAARYVLALGTSEPRKDLPALVAAFDCIAESDAEVRLVLAGPEGWGIDALRDAVARATHGRRIVQVGRVGEDERAALLRGASVLAYPSRYEGFGLPPLEAMAAGTPVVSTDAGALAEVVCPAAEVVSSRLLAEDRPAGIEALAVALARVLTDDVRRAELIAAGTEHAARYTWGSTAARLADLYHRAADR
jgi:glycosyltransferase involved in cell wall biosynthesis